VVAAAAAAALAFEPFTEAPKCMAAQEKQKRRIIQRGRESINATVSEMQLRIEVPKSNPIWKLEF